MNYLNSHLALRGQHVANLFTDLTDGVLIRHLLEIITGERLDDFAQRNGMKLEAPPVVGRDRELRSMALNFKFMKQRQVIEPGSEDDVKPADVVDGNPPLTRVMSRFRVRWDFAVRDVRGGRVPNGAAAIDRVFSGGRDHRHTELLLLV